MKASESKNEKAAMTNVLAIFEGFKEGSQTVTNCHRLKLEASDGKLRLLSIRNGRILR